MPGGRGKVSDPFFGKIMTSRSLFLKHISTFFNQVKTIINIDGLDINNTIEVIILAILHKEEQRYYTQDENSLTSYVGV